MEKKIVLIDLDTAVGICGTLKEHREELEASMPKRGMNDAWKLRMSQLLIGYDNGLYALEEAIRCALEEASKSALAERAEADEKAAADGFAGLGKEVPLPAEGPALPFGHPEKKGPKG